jgi:alkylated DNA repair protein (DNA oxidative demethylase)
MLDLFSDTPPWQEPLAPGAVVLRRFARERAPALLQAIADVARQSPFRQMVTPGGYTMSVAMTNCGGWAGPPIATATSTPRSIR